MSYDFVQRWNSMTLFWCTKCGALIADPEKHEGWHTANDTEDTD